MSDESLSSLARAIREVVAEYSRLPDPILRVQCKGIGKEPDQIVAGDLPLLAERIGAAVGMFTNPEKGKIVRQRIAALVHR